MHGCSPVSLPATVDTISWALRTQRSATTLYNILARPLRAHEVLWLVQTIIASGAGVLQEEYTMRWFPGG